MPYQIVQAPPGDENWNKTNLVKSRTKPTKTPITSTVIKKVVENRPLKSGNSDSKYNFEIFKTKNQTQKRPLNFLKVTLANFGRN